MWVGGFSERRGARSLMRARKFGFVGGPCLLACEFAVVIVYFFYLSKDLGDVFATRVLKMSCVLKCFPFLCNISTVY